MEIWHRITFSYKDRVEAIIGSLNIQQKMNPLPGGSYIIHIDITESDIRWPQIKALVLEKNAVDVSDTIFTNEEILNAEWIRIMPVFQKGYPQPMENMAWRNNTFEISCNNCGAGYRQKAPFRLRAEPHLSNHDFYSLYWGHALFCTQRVLIELKTNLVKGYKIWKAIIDKTGEPSTTVSQLLFPFVAEPALADEDKFQPETCPKCNITKYLYHNRGYMHLKREALRTDVDIQLTNEWFGSGGYTAYREILISNKVAKLIIENKWKGLSLKPILLI